MEHDPDQPGAPFLARWARRKAEARQSVDRSVEPSAPSADDRSPDADAASSAAVDDRPLPSLDDILPDSKLTEFLDRRIPDELQRLALRKAWASDPAISGFIEMAENQWDWNTPGGAPGWGPLNAGANLEMLLAQATGMLPPTAEEQVTASDVVAGDAPTDGAGCGRPSQFQHAVEPVTETSDDAAPQQVAAGERSSSDIAPFPDGRPRPDLLAFDHVTVDSAPDMRKETQREAPQHAPPPHARRHGRALPRNGRTAET